MKKAIGFLAAVLILATIVNVAGCSSGTKEVAPGKERAVGMMQMLPANTSDFSFYDIYQIRTDKNLSTQWQYFEEYFFGNDSISEKINGMGMVYAQSMLLFEGDFSFDELIGDTADGSYIYGGFKVSTSTYNTSIVMINSSAISGYDDNVRNCIDVVNGNNSSLYENGDIKTLLDRLPDGYALAAGIADNETAAGNLSGLLAWGSSLYQSGDNEVETDIYLFNSSDAAQQYIESKANASEDSVHIDRTQDGAFVTEIVTYLLATPTPTATPTSIPASTPEAAVTPSPTP